MLQLIAMVKLVILPVEVVIVANVQLVIIVQLVIVAINVQIAKLAIHNVTQTISNMLNNYHHQLGSYLQEML